MSYYSFLFLFIFSSFALQRDFLFQSTLEEANGCSAIQPIGLQIPGTTTKEVYSFVTTTILGKSTTVLSFNNTGLYLPTAPPNGGGGRVNQWTLIMDVLFDVSNGVNAIPIFSANTANQQLSTESVKKGQGIGTDECMFSGAFQLAIWNRFLVTCDVPNASFNISVDNGTHINALDSNFFPVSQFVDDPMMTVPAYNPSLFPVNSSMLLFGSSDLVGPAGYIRWARFYDYAIDGVTQAALGPPGVIPPTVNLIPCPNTTTVAPFGNTAATNGQQGSSGNNLLGGALSVNQQNAFIMALGISLGFLVIVAVGVGILVSSLLYVSSRDAQRRTVAKNNQYASIKAVV